MSDGPKSAVDLVMERLRKQDADAGIAETHLSDELRAAIADARKAYEARVAERRIMHRSETASVFDPAILEEREAELHRDLDRFERERDEKVHRLREGA